MNHAVIDLETLDTGSISIILSIGVTVVNAVGHIGDIYICPSIAEQLSLKRTISESTLLFWMRQSPEAQVAWADESINRKSIVDTYTQLKQFLSGDCGDPIVYGNGSDFDISILGSLFDEVGLERPWSYRNVGCFRQLRRTFSHVEKPEFTGIKHHALDDSMFEARWLQQMLKDPAWRD